MPTGSATPSSTARANARAGSPGARTAPAQPDATPSSALVTAEASGAPAARNDGLPAAAIDVAPMAERPALTGLAVPTLAVTDRLPEPVTTDATATSSDTPADSPSGAPDPASLAAWVAAWTPPAATPSAPLPSVPSVPSVPSAPPGLAPVTGTTPSTPALSDPPLEWPVATTASVIAPVAHGAEVSVGPFEPTVDEESVDGETVVAAPAAPDTDPPPTAAADTASPLPPDPSLAVLAAQAQPASPTVAMPTPSVPARPDTRLRAEATSPGASTKGATSGWGADERDGPRSGGSAAPTLTAQTSAPDVAAAADGAAAQAAAATTERAPDSFAHRLDGALQAVSGTPASPVSPTGSAPTEVPSVNLATPATAPEFREALGVQVSVLARDGVQQAELHLNPSEMGPISVRIEIDGHQAQVNFGVDHAGTRAIVEAGLPELASALREAGLTLTGGGVSDHARGPGGDAAAGGSRQDGAPHERPEGRRGGSGRGDPPEPAPPAARRVRLPGGVDVYA